MSAAPAQAVHAGNGAEAGDRFVALVEQALATGDFSRVPDDLIERVMTAAVKVYAAKGEAVGAYPLPLAADRITPTEVVVVVSEMIRAADLNLFDLSMWYRRAR
jgi:DNA-binding IclR family transcriptional regulator